MSGYSQLTPEDLALRVGRSGMRVRKLLRQLYPNLAPGTGGRWILTDEQVQAVLDYYSGASPSAPRTVGSSAIAAGTPVVTSSGDVPTDWFWEGHVQDAMVAYLRSAYPVVSADHYM